MVEPKPKEKWEIGRAEGTFLKLSDISAQSLIWIISEIMDYLEGINDLDNHERLYPAGKDGMAIFDAVYDVCSADNQIWPCGVIRAWGFLKDYDRYILQRDSKRAVL
jgi:hypothetical protein